VVVEKVDNLGIFPIGGLELLDRYFLVNQHCLQVKCSERN
jgi:hypothetical protein